MTNINVKQFKQLYLTEHPDVIVISAFNKEGCDFLDEAESEIKKSEKDELQNIINNITNVLGVSPSRIMLYGEVKGEPPSVFRKLCPKREVRRGAMSLEEKSRIIPVLSYKCFVGLDNSDTRFNFIMHEAIENSWNCALTRLGNPDYAIIYIEQNGRATEESQ